MTGRTNTTNTGSIGTTYTGNTDTTNEGNMHTSSIDTYDTDTTNTDTHNTDTSHVDYITDTSNLDTSSENITGTTRHQHIKCTQHKHTQHIHPTKQIKGAAGHNTKYTTKTNSQQSEKAFAFGVPTKCGGSRGFRRKCA